MGTVLICSQVSEPLQSPYTVSFPPLPLLEGVVPTTTFLS
jgi:hypothetical protein